jgi:hypothetical protein
MKEVLIFSLVLLIFVFCYQYHYEPFAVVFGTPPETSSKDASSMKSLLELGSQSQADRKYDVVSEEIMGKINRIAPPEEEVEQEDPKCFNDFYDFDYSSLENYQHGKMCSDKISVCSDRPDKNEIDYDYIQMEHGGYLDDLLGVDGGMDLPNCCCDEGDI